MWVIEPAAPSSWVGMMLQRIFDRKPALARDLAWLDGAVPFAGGYPLEIAYLLGKRDPVKALAKEWNRCQLHRDNAHDFNPLSECVNGDFDVMNAFGHNIYYGKETKRRV